MVHGVKSTQDDAEDHQSVITFHNREKSIMNVQGDRSKATATMNLLLEGQKVEFEVGTGAPVTVLSEGHWKLLG